MTHFFTCYTKLHAYIYPDRACSPADEDIVERAYDVFGSVWSGDRAESWYLEWLAVDPDHQGRGIGKELARWGMDRAEKENIWASVASTRGKEFFYQHVCGFNEEYWSASMGEGNPLQIWGGGRIFWRRPKKLN
jgi:GNAT superfamily N-acetyltransferase